MDVAIGSTGSYSSLTRTKPMNYAVENQSQVSNAYQQSTEDISKSRGFQPVGAANPVQYPNQVNVQEASIASIQKSQETNREFNHVAQSFVGQVTGYSAGSVATGYDIVGSQFDAFA